MSDDVDDLDEQVDVRAVSIIWAEQDEPDVSWTGCSVYEAYGLVKRAMLELEDEMMADDG